MLDTQTPEIDFITQIVRRAAELGQRVQSGMALMGLTKSDFSPVTVGDYAIQAIVAEALSRAFPDDILVAEETADDLRADTGAKMLEVVAQFVGKQVEGATQEDVCAWIDRGTADPAGRFWVLDPIDGTKGYLRGGQYAVALALVENGQVLVSALGCPNLGDGCVPAACGTGALIVAQKGKGAHFTPLFEEGDWTPLHVSDCSEPAQARVLRSLVESHTNPAQLDQFAAELGAEAEPVRMDSQAKYAVMAAGKGEVLLRLLSEAQPDYAEKIWDQAPGSLVIEEAGGRIYDLTGKALDFSTGRRLTNNRGVLASNGHLHDAALEALRKVAPVSAQR